MNKIKLWITTRKKPRLIIIFLCFLIVMGLLLVWSNLGGFIPYKEGLFVNVGDETVKKLDGAVDAGLLPKLNDVPNSGDPIVFSDNPIVAEYDGPDPEFPIEGSVLQCSKDNINGNGSYYLVSETNPKTINLFPNNDRTIINSWTDTWGSAPSFKNCSAFVQGPKMQRRIPLPKVGTDIRCKNEDAQANRHTYRVMSRTKIQPFPGHREEQNQAVAKSWGVNEIDLELVDDCSNINRVRDNTGNVKKFKYKVDVGKLDGQLVKCRQSAFGSNRIPPGNHSTNAVYKVENKQLRWYQNVANAYSSLENIISWGLGKNHVVDVPSCDDIELGGNIRYNAQKLPNGTYVKCSIDVPEGVGTNQLYRVVGNDGELSWTVSDEIASVFDRQYRQHKDRTITYPDCSSFKRGEDISKKIFFFKDYNQPGSFQFTIPTGCIGIHAITVGAGGGGGGGGGPYYEYKSKGKYNKGGGGAGGGGGGGAVRFSNGTYIPINDANRNGKFFAYVGKGGKGGIKGDRKGDKHSTDFNVGKSTSGEKGGNSSIGIEKKLQENGYSGIIKRDLKAELFFSAIGGEGGGMGGISKHYRGTNGNGGSGGGYNGNDSIGYKGTNGQTIPQNNEPSRIEPGGNGGAPINIPNIPEYHSSKVGKGGKGGTGGHAGYDGQTDGENGTNGFVRVIFVF